jgi:hypothetical protein
MILGVDFDGTVVKHAYPEIGEPVDGAIEGLREMRERGVRLLLWTMRSGKELDDAVAYLTANGIELWGVNRNPEQAGWSSSPKAYAHYYVDDAAIGCPLVFKGSERPWVDWPVVMRSLRKLFPAR